MSQPGGSDTEKLLTFTTASGENVNDNHKRKRNRQILIFVALTLIIIAVVVSIIYVFPSSSSSSSDNEKCKNDRYLIVISLDGFRSEYFENPDISTPNLHDIASTGVHIKRLIPVYPSLTFPNHYSIATGMYPGDHGIISNGFYDAILNDSFYMSVTDDDGSWYRAEPIWLTHRMSQNIDKFDDYQSGVVFWVGSDQNASGLGYPDFYINYTYSYPYHQRIETMLDLLESGQYRIIMGYFEEPDSSGHSYGPSSNETKAVVEMVDDLIGSLMDGIKNISIDLFMNTDIVITSDHGMTDVSGKVVYVNYTEDFNLWYDSDNFILDSVTANLFIKLTSNSNFSIETVKNLLTEMITPIDLVQIFDRDTIPFEYRDGYNDRIPDVMVVPRTGYQFQFVGVPIGQQSWLNLNGNHGFNNSDIDMSALFVARGPSFKKNYTKDKVENIHLYEMFCRIMCNMIPSPNNGSIDAIQDILDV